MVPSGVPECVACQNPPASGDGQHGRAGKFLGRLGSWFLGQRPANLRHGPRVLVLAGVPPDLYLIMKVMDASTRFLHGKHVNIKYEPRSALRLPCESAKRADRPMFLSDLWQHGCPA